MNKTRTLPQTEEDNTTFLNDVLTGLSLKHKQLSSKYFYDATGDQLFQQLMRHPAYYLTNCEQEIFEKQTSTLANATFPMDTPFDLIELGAGDATKSTYLLKELSTRNVDFTYMPIDISTNIINHLSKKLPATIAGLQIDGFNGEYFKMLEKINAISDQPKVILFLGANIGNMYPLDAQSFLQKLRSFLKKGDRAIIGFDLKKHPATIREAYDDPDGITAQFNLNLLQRINRELDGNFQLNKFNHYCSYDPMTGACKSYLISLEEMIVTIADTEICFKENEGISMEVSQKYTLAEIDRMTALCGFKPLQHITDHKGWFTDVIWEAV